MLWLVRRISVTIEQIKGLTDWPKTLSNRSVYAEIKPDGKLLRVHCVGRKYVTVLSVGIFVQVVPAQISGFVGL